MFRTALILLALTLASCVSGRAQSASDRDAATNASPPAPSLVIICTLPGTEPRRIPIPDGHSPTDFCPASAITDHFQHVTPGMLYALPAPADAAPLPPTKNAGQPP